MGVVCSMKDSFGFIERADVVKEIFFHYSEYQAGNVGDLQLGDDVEFNVAERNVSRDVEDVERKRDVSEFLVVSHDSI